MVSANTRLHKAPLTEAHLDAADYLFRNHMPLWRDMVTGFAALARVLPGFDRPTVMLKVTTVNALYRAGVMDKHLLRIASHITQVMAVEAETCIDPGLVSRLGALPREDQSGIERTYRSFASKFAHFFVNAAAFPIYDKFSCKMARYHIYGIDICDAPSYECHVDRVAMLQAEVGDAYQYAELDHYLWLAGEYWEWLRDHDASIDQEARGLFAHPPTREAENALATIARGQKP